MFVIPYSPFSKDFLPTMPLAIVLYKKSRHFMNVCGLKHREQSMINTGDQLMCTNGNSFFVEGQIYTVGNIVSKKFFEIYIDNGEYWYATKDSNGIYVRFNSLKGKMSDAWFVKV